MQGGLAVLFFSLLATSTVLADDADSEGWQFVQENGRTYYKKGDIKETAWRVIDGKTYYFDYNGEMVVGWQYIPFPYQGSTIGPYPNGTRLEFMPMSKWFYFGQDGALLEQQEKQVLEAKSSENTGKVYGEKYNPSAEKRAYYFDEDYALKTGWIYEDGHWYYLNKLGNSNDDSSYPLPIGEIAKGWTQDFYVTFGIDRSKPAPWYYLAPETGIMQTGWQYLGNKWYYLRSSGAMATSWYQDGSTWYYLDAENGDMKTGWASINGYWYYFRSSGAMATGWLQDGSTWYYLNASNGDMKTGWFQVNGKWYYAYSSGALAVNTTVDGYYVNYNGEWVQ